MATAGLSRAQGDLLRRRLETQWIEPPSVERSGLDARARGVGAAHGARSVEDVVGHLLAVQAQDFGQGCWALGARTPGATQIDVDDALNSGAVVRSWPMRGTLHFTTPDDLRWMLSLTAAKTVRGMAARHRDLALTEADFERARATAKTELRGGGALSRTEFLDVVSAAGIDVSGQRGMHLIWWLAHQAVVCWGPRSGTQQALVLLDEWAPATHELDREEALGEFVRRYVEGRGPTTLKDFCWWSKISVADAKAGLARVRDRLDEHEFDGVGYLVPLEGPSRTRMGRNGSSGHHALPGFDEYLLGYQSRSPALAEAFASRIVPGNNGIFLPMLVSRGAVVGTWKRRITAKTVTVTLEPFTTLNATERRGFERDLERYARFVGLPLAMATTTPETA